MFHGMFHALPINFSYGVLAKCGPDACWRPFLVLNFFSWCPELEKLQYMVFAHAYISRKYLTFSDFSKI